MDLAALLSHLVQQDLYKVGKALTDLCDLDGNVKRGHAVREQPRRERWSWGRDLSCLSEDKYGKICVELEFPRKIFIESQVVSMEPLEGQGAVHRRYPWENLTDEDDQACLGRLIISVEYWACISFPAKGYARSGDGLPRQELPLQPGMMNRGPRTVLIHGLSHPGSQQAEQGRTMEGPCSLLALHRSENIKPGPQSSSW